MLFAWSVAARANQQPPAMQQATAIMYQPIYGYSATLRGGPLRRGLFGPWRYQLHSYGVMPYQVPLYRWQLHPIMVPAQ